MKIRALGTVALSLLGISIIGECQEQSLCNGKERVVFACSTQNKIVSLCASGDLRSNEGRLIYRFGRSAKRVDLEYGSEISLKKSTFTYLHNPGAKASASTVGFMKDGHHYLIKHAAGVYGYDGGPNFASIRVLKGAQEFSKISCNEPKAIDHIYEELNEISLPLAGEL
jgi:hypothetical protein